MISISINKNILNIMINLKDLYGNYPEIFNSLLEHAEIDFIGVKSINELKESLNKDEKTKYIAIKAKINDSTIVAEMNSNDKLESFGEIHTIDDVNKIFENVCSNPKLLNKAINIGITLPQRLKIDESYNSFVNEKIKKYGIGLKKFYDALIYKIL